MSALKRFIYETIRCTRHNWLHLRAFQMSYRKGLWRVSDGATDMLFPWYPYLAFHDIQGYLFDQRWVPEPGMTVVDAGGCYGEFSLYASRRVGPRGRVLMLEPDPQNIQMARKLFELNGNPSNIEIVPAGLWNQRGTVRFAAGQGEQSAVVTSGSSSATEQVVEIPTYSLASLVEEFNLERLDMVKMDVEGAELEIVAGAAALPSSIRPRYSIASYHIVDGRKTADVLPQLFQPMGYHCRRGYEQHLTTWASPTPIVD